MLIPYLIIGWMLVSFYSHGLFFSQERYPFDLLILAVAGLYLFYQWIRHESHRSAWMLWPFGVAVVFLISFGRAVSIEGNLLQVVEWVSYGCFFFLLYSWVQTAERGQECLMKSIPVMGLMIAASSLMGWYELLAFPDMVQVTNDERLSAAGRRLAGFLQYANTLGAVVGSFYFYHLMWLVRNSNSNTSSWVRRLSLFGLIVYLPVILLTESRAVWLLMLVIGLTLFIIWKKSELIKYIILGTTSLVTGLLLYPLFLWDVPTDTTWYSGLIVTALAGIGYVLLIERLLPLVEKWHASTSAQPSHWLRAWPYGLTVIIGLLAADLLFGGLISRLLPDTLQQRATTGIDTWSARWVSYQDAWSMIKDSPWIGHGGNAWSILVGTYQQLPYASQKLHSLYLQVWVETGVLGFVLFGAACAVLLLHLWKQKSVALPAVLLLLSHAAVDFDMEYGFVWFWLLLLVAVGLKWDTLTPASASPVSSPKPADVWLLYGYRVGMLLLIGGSLFTIIQFQRADQAAAQAYQTRDARVALSHLERAIELNPYHAPYRLDWVSAMDAKIAALPPSSQDKWQAMQKHTLQEGLRFEPYDTALLWRLGLLHGNQPPFLQATDFFEKSIQTDRFNKTNYEAYYQWGIETIHQLRQQNDDQAVHTLAVQLIHHYKQYQQLAQDIEQHRNPMNSKEFRVTPNAKQTIETIQQITEGGVP
ncbi:O-antigen ligase family protein [Brevibacillus dissolubilis]|uniref:O-antigen ligase family protein n=1 Tax=Brevibacillus dissolubilis TaxID=1844116 RepID=UPI00111631B2|nr:O-antigen ligase family protein [Brevibacillus dissolubilis]